MQAAPLVDRMSSEIVQAEAVARTNNKVAPKRETAMRRFSFPRVLPCGFLALLLLVLAGQTSSCGSKTAPKARPFSTAFPGFPLHSLLPLIVASSGVGMDLSLRPNLHSP